MSLPMATVDLKRNYPMPIPIKSECVLFSKDIKKKETYDEQVRALLTDFVVNKLLLDDISNNNANNKQKYVRFLQLIFDSFEKFMNEYRITRNIDKSDLFFAYKGGCLLRIAYLIYKKELGSVIKYADDLFKDYDQSFKISDADFSICINPKLENFKQIYEDVNMFSYVLLNNIRDIIVNNPENYFSFLEESSIARLPSYQKLANDINNVLEQYPDPMTKKTAKLKKILLFDDMYDPINVKLEKVPYQSSRPDIIISSKNDMTLACNIKSQDNVIYSSNNKTITFEKGSQTASFDLIRCKINFICTFTLDGVDQEKNLGGELIDIGIPRIDDTTNYEFFKKGYNKKHLVQYKGVGSELEELNFVGFDLRYLIKDIRSILYIQSPFPWLDPKYVKRIKRHHILMSLLFIQLKDVDTMQYSISCFEFLRNVIKNKDSFSQKKDSLKNKFDEISSYCNNKNLDVCKNDFFNTIKELFESYATLYHILEQKKDITFLDENYPYSFLLDEYNKNIITIEIELDKNILYCTLIRGLHTQDNTLHKKLENISNSLNKKYMNVELLGGTSIYRKYLKYKSKHYQTKN